MSGETVLVARAKRAFAQSSTNTLARQLDLERDLQRLAGASPDAREGIAAFLAKRTPKFTGSRA
jgi:2-(1,2-epoxy-1,2-dihydrophenyl)acetyl-CoA isomerase